MKTNKFRLKLLVAIICLALLFSCGRPRMTPSAASISVSQTFLTNTVDPSDPYKAFNNSMTDFDTTEDHIVSVVELKNFRGIHDIRWDWYGPDNILYYTTNNFLIEVSLGETTETGIVWHEISVKGEKAQSHIGNWQVRIYVDDALYGSNLFTISRNVDEIIPVTFNKNPDAVAIVIGNKDYRHKDIPEVKYAINDARTITQYLNKTLGYRKKNIITKYNATISDFNELFGTYHNHKGILFNHVKHDKSDVFIYYSGHGAPDVSTPMKEKDGYFVPVDCNPARVTLNGYSLELFYNNMSKLPARNITVVLDTCFSGTCNTGKPVISNKSDIGIRAKIPIIRKDNAICLTSASGDQVSSWYEEKKHSLFTYMFLKALQGDADVNKDNQITYREIYNYVSDIHDGVPYYARRMHDGRIQTPMIEGQNPDKVLVRY